MEQLGPRAFAPGRPRLRDLPPTPHTHPGLVKDSKMWQVPALDLARLFINSEEGVGGGVRARRSRVAGGIEPPQGQRV